MLFGDQCSFCHASGPGSDAGQGPNLAGVVGRRAAGDPSFSYTSALKTSGLVWGAETLDRFLTSPSMLIPGTAMPIQVGAAQDRQDLIAFLATTKAAP